MSVTSLPAQAAVVNDALRAHVTRVGFDLTLGKTHIATLVWIDQLLKAHPTEQADRRFYGGMHPAFRWHATGSHGLIDRGLVEFTHVDTIRKRPGQHVPARRIWKITKAGRLVINLLKETGIYQEYEQLIPLRTEAAS